jgi:hypothetical protein
VTDVPPRVLVAGTDDAIDLVTDVLGREAEVVSARSVDEALGKLGLPLHSIVCSVRFDESRMLDFLQALHDSPPTPAPRVVCLRASQPPLLPATRDALQAALEALGIRIFIDFPAVVAAHGMKAARELLHAAILGG